MATPFITATKCFVTKTQEEEEQVDKTYRTYRELILPTLPRQKWRMTQDLYMYQGFWFSSTLIEGVMYLQEHFKPRPTDVLLATPPKCGTTWLKGLIFSIVNRAFYTDMEEHPLRKHGVHECVPFLEVHLFRSPPVGDPEIMPSPRLLCTHVPYTTLPESARGQAGCRVVHIWRNPKDAFVSFWHFTCSWRKKATPLPDLSLEETFELFCAGMSPFGPFWDHVLGYWKASKECPDKVLFLRYEDMKEDPIPHVKRLAEFLGKPFTVEEEEKGTIGEIIELCSFESMSKAEVSSEGNFHERYPSYRNFFRKGEVGDSKNLLTPEMIRRLEEITEEKFKGTGLAI